MQLTNRNIIKIYCFIILDILLMISEILIFKLRNIGNISQDEIILTLRKLCVINLYGFDKCKQSI